MSSNLKGRPLPELESDEQAEQFVKDSDLSTFDLSGGRSMRFEVEPKDTQINMRMPQRLLASVKARAKSRGIPYQRFIREAVEAALRNPRD